MLSGIGEVFRTWWIITIFLLLMLPLGIWKFIEIIIWILNHIRII